MRIQNLLTLVLFLVGTSTYADVPADAKSDIFKCRNYFNTSITPGNQDVAKADAYCKTVMSAAVFCAEQELVKALSKTSLTQDQMTAFRAQYQNKCAASGASTASLTNAAQAGQLSQAQSAQQAQLQQAQAAAAAAEAAKQNQANAAKSQQDKQAGLQQTAQLLGSLGGVAEKVETAYDKAVKENAAKSGGGGGTAAATSEATKKVSGQAESSGGGSGTGAVGAEGLASGGGKVAAPTTAPAPAAPAAPDYGNMSEADFAAAMKKEQMATDVATGKVPAEAASVKSEIPGVADQVAQGEKAVATGDKVEPEPSIHTTNAKTADGEMKTKLTSVSTKAKPVLEKKAPALPFTSTLALLESDLIKTQTTYAETVKPACVTLTEKTEFLCMEGSSPGAVAAKTLVSAAGPILAAVNSAQKACSNTSKVTGLAGTVLTVAKGVCMASQGACTMTCGAALTKWTGSITALISKIQTQAQADASLADTDCQEKGAEKGEEAATLACELGCVDGGTAAYNGAYQAYYGTCKADITSKAAAVKTALTEIQTVSKTEAVPATPGTSAGLAAKCKLKLADALMMAANIGSLMLAKKNADECDKKLSTAGTAGAGATVAQYCEKPENNSTQFCKCQKSPNAEGCPGFTASTSTVDNKDKQDQKGLDLKGAAGGKALFAGGGNGGLNPDGTLAGGGSGSSSSSGDGSLSLASTSGTAPSGSAGAAAGSSFGGASAGRASDSISADREKKKWDFGSFAASIGGMFGGGKSNSKSNGSLSSNQKNAIERKIASDKLSAEISSASGKSNWEKVKQAYLIKENTLLTGQ